MLFQGKDGELRVYEKGDYGGGPFRKGATYFLEVLFTAMDFSSPLKRPRTEERMIMNRGKLDGDSHFVQGGSVPRLEPIPMTFTCMIDDKQYTSIMTEWLSGASRIPLTAGVTSMLSWDGSTTLDGVSLPAFADSTKQSYRVEMKWAKSSGGVADWGQRLDEVYFQPDQTTIQEAEDGLTLTCNALIYGGVSKIDTFAVNMTGTKAA